MKRMWSKNELNSIIQKLVSSGSLSNVKVFEEIVDKDGHNRFHEGIVTLSEIEGVSMTYGRWSLSGTHLMIVLALSIADTTALTDSQTLASIDIPKWIYDKVIPLKSDFVMNQNTLAYKTTWATVNFSTNITKGSNKLYVKKSGAFTASTNNIVRIAFDLIIDNQ